MELIRVADAAEVFGVHCASLPRWVNERRIEGYGPGFGGAAHVDGNDVRRAGRTGTAVKVEEKQ